MSTNGMNPPKKVCVCTPFQAHTEPRGPRHARAIAELWPGTEVVFLDCAPLGVRRVKVQALDSIPNLTWKTHHFPTKCCGLTRLVWNKFRTKLAEWIYNWNGKILPELMMPSLVGISKTLKKIGADAYYAHNIEMLLPASQAVPHDGLLFFDCMEFYSDMGDDQTRQFQDAVRTLETGILPKCAMVTASSPQVGQAYCETYGLADSLSLYNCPNKVADITPSTSPPFQLYWRNAVLGTGQRGLEEALDALVDLPKEITLHLQGRLGMDGGESLKQKINQRELQERVQIHPPHGPDDAIAATSQHTIGLCLERDVNRNHELTVSNKMFDYLMAGLAVISSDLPGLNEVISTSKGGVLFEPGSASSLRDNILKLYNDPAILSELRSNAREYAVSSGNREHQMGMLKEHLRQLT